MKMVNEVSEKCTVCKRFKKARPVPIVSMPLANVFNQVVAMDLIILGHGKYILHFPKLGWQVCHSFECLSVKGVAKTKKVV